MKKARNVFWGIFFVVAAVVVVGSQFSSFADIGFWTILATVLLAAIIIQSVLQKFFAGIFIPLAFLYMMYQTPMGWPVLSGWVLIGAAILISVGLQLLFRPKSWKKKSTTIMGGYSGASGHQNYHHKHIEIGSHENGEHPDMETEENNDDNHPYAKVRLGAASKYLHSDCLESGHFICSMGSLEVYFDQATLSQNGADIFLECNLGAITLYVPKGWLVLDELNTTIGGVDNDNKWRGVEPGAPELRLQGSIALAGIEIKYI